MKLVVFGLTVSSSWGNGHATLWRGLCRALGERGHRVVFFERDVPYYATARDLTELPGGGELILYSEWSDVLASAREHANSADAAMVTSYCPDGIAASELILESNAAVRVFYDLDTSITLARLAAGEQVDYVGPNGYRDFDLVLSYTGGQALEKLQTVLGASRVAPLYGSVDPTAHRPASPQDCFRSTLSYMGTWSADRDEALRLRFIEPARQLAADRFLIGGSKYSSNFPWLPNIYFVNHVPPPLHSAFYCSSKLTLNVTRGPMAEVGYCPSGRLFEAAACGAPVLSDYWPGLEDFYTPGSEILIANSTEEAMDAIAMPPDDLARIGNAARERTLACHTAEIRAAELESLLEDALSHTDLVESNACGA
jgi:spore maturation protein CgeB